jgi:hypothetical protein
MHKKTSVTMTLTIVAILTALSFSNQAFAQSSTIHNSQSQSVTGALHSGKVLGGHVAQLGSFTDRVQSTQAHLGQALGGITTTIHHILKGGSTTGLGQTGQGLDLSQAGCLSLFGVPVSVSGTSVTC